MTSLRIKYLPLEDLLDAGNPDNPKAHDVDQLTVSVDEFGFLEPLVRDERTGQLLSGHGRVKALAAMRARGDDPPGNVRRRGGSWEVPVTVGHATADDLEAKRILVALNRMGERGGWDDRALAELLGELEDDDWRGVGFEPDDLDRLLQRLDPDAYPFPEAPEPPDAGDAVAEPGELWAVGPHRVLCGDAFDEHALGRLLAAGPGRPGALIADPPYGIQLDTDYSKLQGSERSLGKRQLVVASKYRPVAGDDGPFDATRLRAQLGDVREQWWFGANYYRSTLGAPDLEGSWLVWDKRPAAVDTPSMAEVVGSEFELIWSARRHKARILRHLWFGWTARNDGLDRAHPNEKPVELLHELLTTWAPRRRPVIDPFAGSGTTLLAAHATGRPALLLELEPAYVDVILARAVRTVGEPATSDLGRTLGPGDLPDPKDPA